MSSHGIALGITKGHRVTKVEKRSRVTHRKKLTASNRSKLVSEVIREVAGYAPYEKRVMELLKNQLDKRALRLAKRRLGSHQRGKVKREQLAGVLRQEAVSKAKHEKKGEKAAKKEKDAKKGDKKKVDRSKSVTISKWYPADDQPRTKTAPTKTHKPSALRKNIAAGQVLILLVGRFKGKRVIFLKRLQSGLLLVTGPHKLNGVPLRRVNQSTVIPTSHKVELEGVKFDGINDDYFRRSKVQAQKKSEEAFFATGTQQLSEDEKKRLAEKKKTQSDLDTPLLKNVKKVELLRQYLKTRFTITNRMRPHELIF